MPTAKAEVSRPAVPTVAPRSEAMSGRRPASMNSEVPMANTARAIRYSGRGIEWLRGEEKHEGRHHDDVVTRTPPREGHLVTAASTLRAHSSGPGTGRDGRTVDSGAQGADGVTESPHPVRLRTRHGPHATRPAPAGAPPFHRSSLGGAGQRCDPDSAADDLSGATPSVTLSSWVPTTDSSSSCSAPGLPGGAVNHSRRCRPSSLRRL